MPDQRSVAERHTPVVLEMTPCIDEDVAADVDVLPEIGVEGRKRRNVGSTGRPNNRPINARNSAWEWYVPFISQVMRRARSLIASMKAPISGVSRGRRAATCSRKDFEGHGYCRFSRKNDSIRSKGDDLTRS